MRIERMKTLALPLVENDKQPILTAWTDQAVVGVELETSANMSPITMLVQPFKGKVELSGPFTMKRNNFSYAVEPLSANGYYEKIEEELNKWYLSEGLYEVTMAMPDQFMDAVESLNELTISNKDVSRMQLSIWNNETNEYEPLVDTKQVFTDKVSTYFNQDGELRIEIKYGPDPSGEQTKLPDIELKGGKIMIEIRDLTKRYGSFTALDHLNLSLEEGVVFGFVGANGAGKSTTFSILATLLSPTSGDALINGKSVVKEPKEVRKQIGYMPDFFGVYDQLKVDEYLDFYGASYGIQLVQRQVLIPQLLELVNLTNKRYEYVDLLSRGMKQRLCLARALIHDPKVLILDEPASGLDPRARVEMRDILRNLKSMGKTILISSHILPELAEMCDEIGVIDNGKLIAHGNVAAIQAQLQGEKRIVLKMTDRLDEVRAFLEEDPHISSIDVIDNRLEIAFNYRGTDAEQVALLKKAMLADLPIYALSEEEKDLEDVFMAITKGADNQ